MQNQPFLSIYCLVHNHESFLEQCLSGFVIQKTNFSFVAIVHDDASTDNSKKIIEKYSRLYPQIIKPIFEEENIYQRNDGSIFKLMESKMIGKYVAICDGDDYWTDPYKLQKQVDFLEKHPNYSMCIHSSQCLLDTTHQFIDSAFSHIEDKDYSATELFENWQAATSSFVFNRNALNYHISDYRDILYMDIIYVLRCAEIGKIRGISDAMSVYRINRNGVTQRNDMELSNITRYPRHIKFISDNFSCVKKSSLKRALGTVLLYKSFTYDKYFSKTWFSDFILGLLYNPLNAFEILYNKVLRLVHKNAHGDKKL